MHKKILLIGLIIVIIAIITMYIIITNSNKNESNLNTQIENNIISDNNEDNNNITNLNGDQNPQDLKSLQDIPKPDSIIFYHNGVQRTFYKETKEFNEIIKLNNKRDTKNLGPMKLAVDINGLIQNDDMLQYTYQNYDPVYINLIKDKELENNNIEINWISVGYDSKVFNQFIYGGLLSADELIDYLYSL